MNRRILLGIVVAWFGTFATLRAQFTWTGAGTSALLLGDNGNWLSGIAPAGVSGSEDLTFGSASPQINVLVATSVFHHLTFTAARPAYSFNGTGTTPVLTLNGNLTVSSGSSTFVDFRSGLGVFLSSGNHTFDLGANVQFAGTLSGTGSLIKRGGGDLTINGASSYSGDTIVQDGALIVDFGSFNSPSGNVVVGDTSGNVAALSVTNGGTFTDGTSLLGNGAGSFGSATVDGVGSTWTNNTYLYVGGAGEGQLNLSGGGTVNAPNVSIGNNTNGIGALSITDSGSNLAVSNTLYVGSQGDGSLDLSNGGAATSVTGSIGNNPGGFGNAHITGNGSVWNNSGALIVGNASGGFVDLRNQGAVHSGSATVGALAGVDGHVTTDSYAVFSTSGNLVVGGDGNGYLDVLSNSSAITGGQGILGNNSGSSGLANIEGVGAIWTTAGDMYVGNAGQGILQLIDAGSVAIGSGSGTLFLGHSGGDGIVQIGYDGEGYSVGGFINAAAIVTGSGTGTVILGTDSDRISPYYLTKDGTAGGIGVAINGGTQVVVENGYNVLTAASNYSGGTDISSGTVVAGNNTALGSGAISINGGTLRIASGITLTNGVTITVGGGTVGGSGTLGSPLTVGTNGHLSPGNSPGTLTFSSGLTLASGGALDFEVQAAGGVAGTGYDLVSVSGALLNITATSGSPFAINIFSLNGGGAAGNVGDFSSGNSYSWTIFTSSAGISNFAASNFAINAAGFTNGLGGGAFSLSQSGNNLLLNFSPVPEPSTMVLSILGLGALAFRQWRRRRI